MALGLSRGRPHGRHDPYSAARAAPNWLSPPIASSFFSRPARPAARDGAGRQRDRRRRLGAGPAGARLMRACSAGDAPVHPHRPTPIRPWQHVLEPACAAICWRREHLCGPASDRCAGAWNFGPDSRRSRAGGRGRRTPLPPVGRLSARCRIEAEAGAPAEAPILRLDATQGAAGTRLAAALAARRGAGADGRAGTGIRRRRRHRALTAGSDRRLDRDRPAQDGTMTAGRARRSRAELPQSAEAKALRAADPRLVGRYAALAIRAGVRAGSSRFPSPARSIGDPRTRSRWSTPRSTSG